MNDASVQLLTVLATLLFGASGLFGADAIRKRRAAGGRKKRASTKDLVDGLREYATQRDQNALDIEQRAREKELAADRKIDAERREKEWWRNWAGTLEFTLKQNGITLPDQPPRTYGRRADD